MYNFVEFGRKKFSKDKKKRKKIFSTYAKGVGIGLASTAIPLYALNKLYYKPAINSMKDIIADPFSQNKHIVALDLLDRTRENRIMLNTSIGVGGVLGGITAANIALHRDKINSKRKRTKKKFISIRPNTKEKYNFWHHV